MYNNQNRSFKRGVRQYLYLADRVIYAFMSQMAVYIVKRGHLANSLGLVSKLEKRQAH